MNHYRALPLALCLSFPFQLPALSPVNHLYTRAEGKSEPRPGKGHKVISVKVQRLVAPTETGDGLWFMTSRGKFLVYAADNDGQTNVSKLKEAIKRRTVVQLTLDPNYSHIVDSVSEVADDSKRANSPGEGQTTVTLRQEADAKLQHAIKELKKVYAELKSKLKDEDELRERLAESQTAWEEYRDKATAFEAAFYKGGTIQPQIRLLCLTRLTKIRTEELVAILKNELES